MTPEQIQDAITWLQNIKDFFHVLARYDISADPPLFNGIYTQNIIESLLEELDGLRLTEDNPLHSGSFYPTGVYLLHETSDEKNLELLMTLEQWQKLEAIATEHESKIHYRFDGNLNFKFRCILQHYRDNETNALSKRKSFHEDVLTWMRAIALIADSINNAGTHKEKDARLRGLLSMIETSIQKIRDGNTQLSNYGFDNPDIFRSDYPVQRYIERVRELEVELEKVKQTQQLEVKSESVGF